MTVGIVINTVRDRIASATNTTRFEILTETFGENAAALDAMEAALDNDAKRSALAEELENLDRRIEALRYRDVKAAEELYDEAYKELLRVVGRDLGEDDSATQQRNAQSLLTSVKQGRNVDNRYTPYTIRLAGRVSAYGFEVDRARARADGLDNIDSLPDPGALSKTWHAVAIKRMVRWAAQHGFHKVAWSTGEQQAALWSSAFGQVGMIQADVTNYGARRVEIGIQNRGVDDIGVDTDGVITYATGIINHGVTLGVTTIHDLLGKDAADKIMAMPPGNQQALDLTEARINVGRRGQVRFYNEILPNTVKKLFKKQKVRVETTDLLTKPQLGPTGPVTQVHAIRITPELLDYAIAGFPLYQRNRGRIMLPGNSVSKGRTIIEMFEGADRSTFLHELGHYMLQAFTELALTQTAPAQMKADLQTIHEWMGREPGDVGPYTEEEQEKWARGVEAYVMKGEAPSIGLRRVFARFVRWLTAIYRTVAQLNVELTPEITEVMDRMLATDDQIAIAKASQQWGPMFSTAPPGMSDQEWQAYRQLAADADDEAQAALLEKTMNQIFVQRSEEYRARKQQLSEEIAAGLGQIDTYRTLFRLQQDKEQLRLDKKQLVEVFGEEVLQELGRKRMGGRREIWSAKDGADIDVVAQSLGWTDAATMIDALRRMEPPKIKVANDVETRLREEFGDFLDSGSIQDEAVAALHRRKREQLLGAEMTAIRKHAERSGKKLPRKRSINELREEARDLVARMSVRQAENPQLFLREERKAAREAQAAFSQVVREAIREAADERQGATAEDPLVVAYRAKERQMLAHYKYIESRKVERLVQRMQRQARRLNKRSAARTVGDPYITRIHELLEQYDFRKVGPGKVRRTQQLREFIRMMTEQNRTSELAFDIDSPIVQDANRIHYTELPVEKLEELETVLKNLEHLGRTKRKLQDMHRRRLFAEERRKIVQQLNSNFDYKPRSRARSGDKTSEAGQRIRELWLVSQTTDAIIMGLDGTSAADVGPIGQAIAQPIHEASARAVKRRHENWMWVRDMFKRAFGDNWKTRIKELQTTKISIQTRDGADTISLFELVALALNTGNKDNFERLTNPDSRGAMRPVEIERVLREHMTEDMWRVVAEVWERIDSFWPEIAAQERTLTGVAPPRVEAALQVDKQLAGVPDFVPNGGYYPIRYDNRLSAQIGDTDVDEMVKNTMTGTAAKAQTRHGHTKERTQTTGLPIALDFGMALRHMNDVVYDLELRQPLSNSLRLLKDAEVATAFNDRGLSAEREMLMSWVQDVANGGSMATGGVETFFRHLRVGLSTAAMGFSVSTALQQPLGLLNAANTVGPVNMVRAMFRYMSNPRKYGQHASQLSPFMEERQQTFQRDLAVMNEAMQARPDARRTWSEFVMSTAFYALQKIQFYVVDVPTWLAGYERAIRQGKTEQEAAAIADRIVARSQGSGIISDRSAIERGKMTTQSAQMMAGTEAVRAFTAFQSFMITRFSLTSARARNLIRERSSAAAMELASDITLGYVLPAMLAQLILGRLWDEREREKMEEDGIPVWWMQQVLLELASGPWINQVAAFWQSREGTNSALRGGKDVIEGLRSASELVAIMADAEDEDRAKRALKDTITSIGIMFKLPSVQINRVIEESFEDDLAVKDHISVLEAAQGKDYTFIED